MKSVSVMIRWCAAPLITCALLIHGVASARALRVGAFALKQCETGPAVYCARASVPLDWVKPRVSPRIDVAFRYEPAASGHARGTVVAVEGGPGYPASGSEAYYQTMYGHLLSSYNLLLVDNRGTGGSTAIDCEGLQRISVDASPAAFGRAAGACGSSLDHRWRYRTGGWVRASGLFSSIPAADDLAFIIRSLALGPVDLYGDSYGAYFAQVFAERHPALVHSVILDSVYEVRHLDPWYRSTIAAMPPAFDSVCAASPACRSQTRSAWGDIERLARRLDRRPAVARVPNQSGREQTVKLTGVGLVNLINDAGADQQVYQQLDAAARALLGRSDAAPLARLYAQRLAGDEDYANQPAGQYSAGLYLAVACTDYPQLFSTHAPVSVRARQLRRAEQALPPRTFSPFTVAQWVAQDPDTEAYTACLHWPAPGADSRPAPGAPAHRLARRVPVLILSGALDLWTPASGDAAVARQLGGSVQIVQFAEATHVVADDSTACGDLVVQRFVARSGGDARLGCVGRMPAIHAVGRFPTRLSDTVPLSAPRARETDSASDPGGDELAARRLAAAAVATAGDAVDRFTALQLARDAGLRGGTVTAGSDGSTLHLRGDELVPGVAVSGMVRLSGDPTGTHGARVTARLTATSRAHLAGRFTAQWSATAPGAVAVVSGTVDGTRLSGTIPAP